MPADLNLVVAVRDSLTRAWVRAWAMGFAVREPSADYRALYTDEHGFRSERHFWLPVMRDRFTITDDGGVHPLPDEA